MMYLSVDEQEKIRAIDKVFSVLSAEDIVGLAGQSATASKLRGDICSTPVFENITNEIAVLQSELVVARTDIMRLQAQNNNLQTDMRMLLETLNNYVFNQDGGHSFQTLKSSHGVY